MPRLKDGIRFRAYYNAAVAVIRRTGLEPYTTQLNEGQALYRYTGFWENKSTAPRDIVTVKLPPQLDKGNRWTGVDEKDNDGTQGVYFSSEAEGHLDTNFPEYQRYQNPAGKTIVKICVLIHNPGEKPRWQTLNANDAKSMALITVSDQKTLLNLTHDNNPSNINNKKNKENIHHLIFEEAKKQNPEVFKPDETIDEVYNDYEIADYNRAIAKAVFDETPVDGILVTSVQDVESSNVVIKSEYNTPIDRLKVQGIMTWYRNNETGEYTKSYTVNDLSINKKIGTTEYEGNMDKEEMDENWSDLAESAQQIGEYLDRGNVWVNACKDIDKRIHSEVTKRLEAMEDPFTQDMDQVEEQLLNNDFLESVQKEISDFVIQSAMVNKSVFNSLFKEIHLDGVTSLLDEEIVEPQFKKLDTLDASQNYIRMRVREELVANKAHWLEENASTIQQKLTQANTTITETSEELQTKRSSLNELNETLTKEPEDDMDKNYMQLKMNLQSEIMELERKVEEAHSERENAERELEEKEREKQENENKRGQWDDVMEERRRLFEGGVHPNE
jgi:hypothetical protein